MPDYGRDGYLRDLFNDLPNHTLIKMHEAKKRVSPQMRGLFFALLQDPEDITAQMALKDLLEETTSRPECVTVGGKEIPLAGKLSYEWWRGVHGLPSGTVHYLSRVLGLKWSIADLCNLTWESLIRMEGIGRGRAADVVYWLAEVGLALSGMKPYPLKELREICTKMRGLPRDSQEYHLLRRRLRVIENMLPR